MATAFPTTIVISSSRMAWDCQMVSRGLSTSTPDVGLVDNELTLIRDRKPPVEQPSVDCAGLVQAENAVALLAAPAKGVDDYYVLRYYVMRSNVWTWLAKHTTAKDADPTTLRS